MTVGGCVQTAFEWSVAGLLGYTFYSEGVGAYRIAAKEVSERGEDWGGWSKTNSFFLASFRSIGSAFGLLDWARACGWMTLGAFAPAVTFVGYPCLLVTSACELVQECFKAYALERALREDPQRLHNPTPRRISQGIALCARVGQVAFPLLAGAGFLLSIPLLTGVGFALMLLMFFLLGVSAGLTLLINQEERVGVAQD